METTARRGRPFNPEIAVALRDSAERILTTEGYAGLSVDRIVNEVGTTRPTFYRRYPNLGYLTLEVLQRRFGADSTTADTGGLESDLRALQEAEIEMFSHPLLKNNLPSLLELANTDPKLCKLAHDHFIASRRRLVRAAIEKAVARNEIAEPTSQTVDYVCDLLVGPVMTRSLALFGGSLDSELAQRTTASALSVLRSQQ